MTPGGGPAVDGTAVDGAADRPARGAAHGTTDRAARRTGARRVPFLLAAGLCLLAGLDAALVLLDLPAPVTGDRLPSVHGVLLVLGFAGTLVALERAVALGGRWPCVAPGLLGAGGLLLLTPVDPVVPRLLLVAGCAALVALYVRFWRRQPSAALVAQGAGAVCALGGALLWLGGLDVPRLLPWLVAFLVLTIAGERLELARVAALAPAAEPAFLACVAAVAAGVAATLMWPAPGTLLLGAALLALVAWLLLHDVARRLLRSSGLPRFTAGCLLAGYGWLALAGTLWLVTGPVTDGTRYDAVVHAVFLGFVMSMIMAHAPVILPAVLRRPLPHHPAMSVAAWLLHLSLVLRVFLGDLRDTETAWRLGGALNIAAVLLFAVTAATASVRATRSGNRTGLEDHARREDDRDERDGRDGRDGRDRTSGAAPVPDSARGPAPAPAPAPEADSAPASAPDTGPVPASPPGRAPVPGSPPAPTPASAPDPDPETDPAPAPAPTPGTAPTPTPGTAPTPDTDRPRTSR
ncbi:hypothetical protein [Streptomyces sp. bgisy022]|uniref:hypothetical protein n=1 Tax=Streptomyces sp. bgisy022 TaxID=3413769 RepID=UPI003D71235E